MNTEEMLAFPIAEPTDDGNTGLTKLEYFACKAMQGMLVHGARQQHGGESLHPETVASLAVNQAKALIAELNKLK